MRIASLLLVALLGSGASHAFEASQNFWESGQGVFHVGISGSSPSGGTWNAAFNRAMDAWSTVSAFEFVAINEYLDPCLNRGPNQFGDNATGVDFNSTVCGSEFNEGTLAVTLTAGDCINSDCTGGFTISDADIVFNSNENWDIYSGPLRFDDVSEFERVALHELGHALGLNHSTADPAIMQAFVSDTETLQVDDIAGAVSIYGAGEPVLSSVANIYGVALSATTNSTLSGPSDSTSLSGELSGSDNQLDGKSLDLYQYTFENDSTVDIQLSSAAFDPFLYLIRVDATQNAVAGAFFSDDNSGTGNGARINRPIQAGTYWFGVSHAGGAAAGSYDLSLISNTDSPSSSFESFVSPVYGVDVLINPNPNINGTLGASDFQFNERFLDLIQFEVTTTATVKIDLRSPEFDTNLLLVDVVNDEVGTLALQNDDNGSGTNSQLQTTLLPGTYWIGVTSFDASETGDYSIVISLVLP